MGILWFSLKYNKAHLYFAAQTVILNSFSQLIVTFIVNVGAAITIGNNFSSLLLEEWGTTYVSATHMWVRITSTV